MKPLFLVTAANGNTGFPAAQELLRLGYGVRAFVRDPQKPKAQVLKRAGAELFVGDIEDIRDVRKALQGVEGAYFIPTYPNVLFQGITFATAAEEQKIKHVVVLTQWLSLAHHPSKYTKEHWLVDKTFERLSHATSVTTLNPGLFAYVYFLMPEPMLQLGMMPDFGTNAPPSSEDIGLVAAHVLLNPEKHSGQTYRITGRDLLKPQEMAHVVGKVVGRKVKAEKLPTSLMLKMMRSYGFPQTDASQIGYYIMDAQAGSFAINAPSTVVKDIVGKQADDFETITRRYLQDNPLVKQSMGNKLKTMGIMARAMFTPLWNMQQFERDQHFPQFKNMTLSHQDEEWLNAHQPKVSLAEIKKW